MTDLQGKRVARRRVFYIPGYDPIPPRRYRELFRRESDEQADISGYEITLSARPRDKAARYGWQTDAQIDGQKTHADFDVLLWSDLVRGSMSRNIAHTYWLMLRTVWTHLSTGTLRRLTWLRKGPVIAALYPVGMLIAQLLLAVTGGWIAGALLNGVLDFLVSLLGRAGLSGVAAWSGWHVITKGAGWALAFALIALALRWCRRIDNKLYAYYLMHDYAYSAQLGGAYPPALETRMAAFTDEIADALKSDVDEVLVIGHSSGAYIGVSVLADLIRAGRGPGGGPVLSFLTLGQVVPMVSFLPHADRLRADLHYLAARDELTWVDVSAPGDGCSFALCDPVSVTGVDPPAKRWPLVISAAFTQTLSPERWQALRWRFFRLHFQYLCAFDRPGDYDYFQITGGPLSLGQRYAGRQPSKSRIDVAASKYTSMNA